MTADNPEEKARPNYGERRGIVLDVVQDFYLVTLYTPKGWRYYKFPRHLSKDILQKNDSVKCYIVDTAGKPESRLEKIPEKVFTKEEIEEIERKFTELLKKSMEEITHELEDRDQK